MSKVVRVDKENLSAELTMTITKDDYVPKLDSELRAYRKKAHMKGFRKGKMPMGVIRKMYGQSLLAEVINDTLQKTLTKYLTDENIEILGQPIPSDDQKELNFDISELQDFEFKFDIGLAPEFEMKGLSADTSFDRYAVEVPASMLDKEIEQARTKFGERESVDTVIEDNDVVTFNAEELDGDSVKENGWASTFSVLVNRIGVESVKEEILKKKKGDKIRFNVYTLEKDAKPETVKKYMLNITDNDEGVEIGEEFEGTIQEVQRIMPAELNEEFFNKAFGEGNVKSIEEARSKFEEEITKYYDKQSESLLFRDLQDFLLEQNDMEIPNAFLKRWIKSSNEQATEEVIENEYGNFAKNLQWSLIKGKIVQQFDLSVTEEEIFESFKDRVRGYFQGYGDELIVLNTANRLMEDKKQVDQLYQELMSDKLFEAVREVVTVNDKKISAEDFDVVIRKAHDEVKAAQDIAQITTPEETAEQEVTEDIS
jgi:trigger factor